MRKFTPFLIITIGLLISNSSSFAQLVGGNLYLPGRYLEIGQTSYGGFGAATPPTGYHPYPVGALAEVYDIGHDGWTVGTPALMGDYTYPGSPYEGWGIQVGGHTGLNFAFVSDGGITGSGSLTGSNVSYSNTGGCVCGNWVGTTAGGQLAINMETRIDTNASWVVVIVHLYNTGATTLDDIYYFRGCDPDNDEAHGGSFATTNTVTYQNDTAHRVLVSSWGETYTNAYMGLGTKDSRAKAFINTDWPLSISDLSTVYSETASIGGIYTAGSSLDGDNGIGLVFNIGNIAAGDSATFAYAYIFNGVSGIDSAFTSIVTISASATSACATFNDTLICSNPYGTVTSIQWQSSADSATWSNISGATNAMYVISGLTATTYYRVLYSPDSTAGIKVTYIATCCSGTPPVGTASVSVTSCSSCSATLSLAGYPVLAGLSFQWQISLTSTGPWANIPGATTEAYTYTPCETNYYRCFVTCIPSASSAYSTVVEVPYEYHISSHNVTNAPGTSCGGSDFYIQANGISPLLMVKTYYGDNTTDSVALVSGISTASVSVAHTYSCPGNYTVKQILYWNNIAQDSVTFSYEYYYCRTLPIKLYIDLNADCIKQSAEPYNSIPVLVKVDSNSIPIDTISVTGGLYYEEHGMAGTIYGFSIIPGTYTASCPAASIIYDTIAATVNTYPVKYYGLTCSNTAFDLAVNAVVPVTGQHDQWGNIYLSNDYCPSINATLTMHFSPKYNGTPSQVYPASTSISGNTIVWDLALLSSENSNIDLHYQANYSGTPLIVGDTVISWFQITPITGDINSANNTEIIVDTIKAGTDPNEMFVSPSGCIADTATQLQYTISFMNVGNDTAFNIYVMDTLSPNVDPQSLRLVMASNTMNIVEFNDGVNNIARFDFPAINLLDSSACPQCSGAVIFNVNTLPGQPLGATIFNHAGIYFDINPVVMTNTVENITGSCPTTAAIAKVQSANSIQIFPNPATNELTIIQSTNQQFNQCTITNSIGQEMIQQLLGNKQTQVNVSALPPGVYYITFRGDNGPDSCREVQKFVKM